MMSQAHLKRLIRNYYRRLQKLKEREALYGLDVTPGILLEIEDIEEKIADLEQELTGAMTKAGAGEKAGPLFDSPHHESLPRSPTFTPSVINQLSLSSRNPALRQLRRWLLQK